jgi:hypothetical protein
MITYYVICTYNLPVISPCAFCLPRLTSTMAFPGQETALAATIVARDRPMRPPLEDRASYGQGRTTTFQSLANFFKSFP